MKKECFPLAFNLIDTLITLSPKQKKISRYFYLGQKLVACKKWTNIFSKVETIAKKCDCSEDTVRRFLKEYPTLVQVKRRFKKTNLYIPQEIFMHAMQFMDTHNMLEKNRRQQKNWYFNEMKKKLELHRENVRICGDKCRVLRPNPLLIPNSYKTYGYGGEAGNQNRKKEEESLRIPKNIDALNLPYEIKLKLSMVPEGAFQNALDSYRYKTANGWKIRDPGAYVAGAAINVAIKWGHKLNWSSFYKILKSKNKEFNGN